MPIVRIPGCAHPPTAAASLANLSWLHNAGGVIIGGVSVFQDISLIARMERRQAEILAQSEAALRRLQAVQAVTDTALAHLPAQDLHHRLSTSQ